MLKYTLESLSLKLDGAIKIKFKHKMLSCKHEHREKDYFKKHGGVVNSAHSVKH